VISNTVRASNFRHQTKERFQEKKNLFKGSPTLSLSHTRTQRKKKEIYTQN
jgi:hypothetical protein